MQKSPRENGDVQMFASFPQKFIIPYKNKITWRKSFNTTSFKVPDVDNLK